MAYTIKSSKTASFEITLQNKNDDTDVTKRTISFDLPSDSTIGAQQVSTIASTYFAVAGMSNVFQPTSWRDYKGLDDVYIFKGVTPSITEKTVTEGEYIEPPSTQKKMQTP